MNKKQPNIVFVLCDNVGWGDFSCYGGNIPTPRIDKLASEGTRFNNYTVESQCTPTRSAILTGRQSVWSGTYTVPLPGQGKSGLTPWEYTIAKLLSDAGYATSLFGKWHNVKTWLRYCDGDKPIVTPQFPMAFDLGSDPGEHCNLFNDKMDMGWVFGICMQFVAGYEKSVAQYPNIKPGSEFDGYPTPS